MAKMNTNGSRKMDTVCCTCRRHFWAWDSKRKSCYLCAPEPKTPQEKMIRAGDFAAVRL